MPQIALIGAGRMGRVHARNAAANPRLQLTHVVDSDPAAEAFASELGAAPASLEAVLEDSSIKGVVIASPTATHLDLVLASLAAGKAVFCEKPLDLELSRLKRRAARLAEPAPLLVAFNRRFDPQFRALKARIDAGAIGRIESLNLVSHDPAPPPPHFIAPSGGLFFDFTIHDFDMAGWLIGRPPVEVFAWASSLVDPAIAAAGDVDTARLVLRTATGQLCAISNSRRSGYGYDQRVEAYGSEGALMVANARVSTVETWSEAGTLIAPIDPGFQSRYAASYAAELDHFADVMSGSARPLAGYGASAAAVALAEAARRSLASGRSERVEAL